MFIWRLCLLLTMGCLTPLDTKEMEALLLANRLQQLLEHDIIPAFFEAKKLGDVKWHPLWSMDALNWLA